MVRDAQATRRRILDAATAEFAAHGLAGSRVERIAAAARANKRLIYVHYGNKEALFVATLHHVLEDVAQTVPLTVDDLPAYAGRLFDYLREHPHARRLGLWRQLERPDAGPDESGFYAAHIARMLAERAHGDDDLPPADLIVMVAGLAQSWFLGPDDLLTAGGANPHDPSRIAAHRASLVEAVRRITARPTPG
ncbi:MAG: transcriptional regulator, TetR family [Aeromicrobium sp.]|nr:transcriptional regulator, TetR family [Aeromicrobium sp.]